MNVLVFGASGGTGRHLVRQALALGHRVSAFVRDPSKLGAEKNAVRVIEGDVTDAARVEAAVQGHDAALSVLGAANPFKPDPALTEGVGHILSALQRSGGGRFIYLSFIGVPESRAQFGFLGANLIAPVVLKHATNDHARKEALIQASSLPWTIVRAPKLTDGALTSRYRVGERLAPKGVVPSISRADVAELMLRQIEDPSWVRRSISVMH